MIKYKASSNFMLSTVCTNCNVLHTKEAGYVACHPLRVDALLSSSEASVKFVTECSIHFLGGHDEQK